MFRSRPFVKLWPLLGAARAAVEEDLTFSAQGIPNFSVFAEPTPKSLGSQTRPGRPDKPLLGLLRAPHGSC